MRHFVDRTRLGVTALASLPLLPLILLAGCDKLTPQGPADTMSLLRAGSEKVCIAPDVQATLRDIIVPKPSATTDTNVALDTRVKAAASVTLRYDTTTLQAFDKDVTKAVCSTTVRMASATGDKSQAFVVTYAISPSAEDGSSFVVTADSDAPRSFANDLIADAIDDVVAEAAEDNREREEQQKQHQLLSVVNEKWLTGAWITTDAAAENCGNGNAWWFENGHVLEGIMGKGRWALANTQLHMIGGDTNHFDAIGTIDEADPISFQMSFDNGERKWLRRCTQAETEALPQPTTDGSAAQ